MPGLRRIPYQAVLARRRRAFHRQAWAYLAECDHPILWVGSALTATALGERLRSYPYLLHLLELVEYYPANPVIRALARQARAVVVPEYCRAHIGMMALDLASMPLVLPNKPFSHPEQRQIPITDPGVTRVLEQAAGRRILLYQGVINAARCPLTLARAAETLRDTYALLLVGMSNPQHLEAMRRIHPGLLTIPYLVPPLHLHVTSHADIGLAYYSSENLNNLFCAPNKIYEYAGFGIPMLARDIPGLRYTVGEAGAAVCADWSDPDQIVSGVQQIAARYPAMCEAARGFFAATDTAAIIHEALARV